MARESILDELDSAVDVAIAGGNVTIASGEISQMLQAAAELRMIANAEFKARLKFDLVERALVGPARAGAAEILPTLFLSGYGTYPIQRANFAASLAVHAVVLLLVLFSGVWMAQKTLVRREQSVSLITSPESYVLPPSPEKAGGGGGGGDSDRLRASKGSPPRFTREQLAPPAVVIRNVDPKLAVEPTVVGPPTLVFPQTNQVGDPLSAVLSPPSNGHGDGGGIGSGSGTGIGSGYGPGIGPGRSGGIGGGVYRIGGGVSAPRVIYDPDPEYSEEARKARFQGTVVLWAIVDANGRTRDLRIARSLGMGLDQKALEAVRTWRFEPAMKDGHPVPVQMMIEVSFRLY